MSKADELRDKAAACRVVAMELIGADGEHGPSYAQSAAVQAALYDCFAALIGALPSERDAMDRIKSLEIQVRHLQKRETL